MRVKVEDLKEKYNLIIWPWGALLRSSNDLACPDEIHHCRKTTGLVGLDLC